MYPPLPGGVQAQLRRLATKTATWRGYGGGFEGGAALESAALLCGGKCDLEPPHAQLQPLMAIHHYGSETMIFATFHQSENSRSELPGSGLSSWRQVMPGKRSVSSLELDHL